MFDYLTGNYGVEFAFFKYRIDIHHASYDQLCVIRSKGAFSYIESDNSLIIQKWIRKSGTTQIKHIRPGFGQFSQFFQPVLFFNHD